MQEMVGVKNEMSRLQEELVRSEKLSLEYLNEMSALSSALEAHRQAVSYAVVAL